MKSRSNKVKDTGPFLRQEFIPEKRICRFALEELTRYRLLPDSPGPVAVEKFCDRKWGFPEDYLTLEADVMGRSSFSCDGFERIEINERLLDDTTSTGKQRVRSTLSHEIGHAILHEGLFVEKLTFERSQGLFFDAVDRPSTAIVCRNTDILRPKHSQWWEIQANKFMAAILMPRPLLLQILEPPLLEYDESTARPKDRVERYYGTINLTSATFRVSREMANIAVDEYLERGRVRPAEEFAF